MPRTHLCYFWIFHLVFVCASAQSGTLTINSDAILTELQGCVQGCITEVGLGVGCDSPYYNACVCKTDLRESASTYMSGCITDGFGCNGDTNEIRSAISIFEDYCSHAVSPASTTADDVETLTSTAAAAPASNLPTETGPEKTVVVTQVVSVKIRGEIVLRFLHTEGRTPSYIHKHA